MAGAISLQGGSFRDALNRQNDPLAVCEKQNYDQAD